MAIISLGKIDKKMISILMGCIFCFLSRSVSAFEATILFDHPIIVSFSIAIAKCFNIIPFIIIKLRSKKVHKSDNENNNKINKEVELYYIKTRIKNKVKYAYYLLISFVLFMMSILYSITQDMKANYWIWDIVFTTILSHLMLKFKLYKHHYLCIIMIILIGVIIDLIYENIQNDFSNNILSVLFKFLREVCICLFDVISKYVMDTKYCSVYELSFFTGVFDFILIGIFAIFDYYFFKLDNLGQYFNNLNRIEIINLLAFMFSQLGIELCLLFTEKNYTPCHIFIIYVFGQLAYYINFSLKSLVIFICFFLILIFSLIFNEIIELNFCGLSDNIKRNIINRGEYEDHNIELIELNNSIDIDNGNYVVDSSKLEKTFTDNDFNDDIKY